MKRFLMIAGLLLTLCNVGVGVTYAKCKCYESDGHLACEGEYCFADHNGRCYCSDEPIEELE